MFLALHQPHLMLLLFIFLSMKSAKSATSCPLPAGSFCSVSTVFSMTSAIDIENHLQQNYTLFFIYTLGMRLCLPLLKDDIYRKHNKAKTQYMIPLELLLEDNHGEYHKNGKRYGFLNGF